MDVCYGWKRGWVKRSRQKFGSSSHEYFVFIDVRYAQPPLAKIAARLEKQNPILVIMLTTLQLN